MLDEQEETRLILLSPGAEQDKLIATTKLITEKECNRFTYEQQVQADPKRKWLKDRIQGIKTANINDIIIPNSDKLYDQFLKDHTYLIPQHQRDLKRLISLIKAHALLNCFSRERQCLYETKNNIREYSEVKNVLIATQEDIDAGFNLYKEIKDSNEIGITPETLEIYKALFLNGTEKLTIQDILRNTIKNIIDSLVHGV